MPDDLIMVFWIGGILYLVGTPIIIWLLFVIKDKLNSLMSFREWFMTAYDFNEKIVDAIDHLDNSLKRRIFELSLQERDRFKKQMQDLKKDIEESNKKESSMIIMKLVEKLESDDSKNGEDN